MDFSAFDDELFSDASDSKYETRNSFYAPKRESPRWFLSDDEAIEADIGILEKERMRAAYFYWIRDYESAIRTYERLFSGSVPGAFRLECMESYARALMACDRLGKSENVAIEFYKCAINYDQQIQGLNLLSDLYWRRGDYKRCAVAAGCLEYQMGGGNGDIWYRLGHCFLRWNDAGWDDCSGRDDDLIDVRRLAAFGQNIGTESQRLFQKCLIRAYNSFTTIYSTSVGCARERIERMRRRIENDANSVLGIRSGSELLAMRRSNHDPNETTQTLECYEKETTTDMCQSISDKSDLDKMLDIDIVTAFERFVLKWLSVIVRRFSIDSSKFRFSYAHGASSVPLLNDTITDLLLQRVEQRPEKQLFVFCQENVRKTYEEFYSDARRLASGLLALGVSKGDRVGIWAPNIYEWVVTQFATALAGMTLVNINPAYRTPELEYCLRKVGVRCLISSTSFKNQDYYSMVCNACPSLVSSAPGHLHDGKIPDLKQVIFIGDEKKPGGWLFSEILHAGDSATDRTLMETMHSQQADEPVNIQFTSGTTGSPKGATLSHHNIVNNAYFMGRRMNYHCKPTTICCPPPLYHCFGCVFGSLAAVVHGISTVFPSPSFDALSCLKAVEKEKCTNLYGTPTMFIDMLNHKDFSQYRYDSLRGGTMAGAPSPIEVCKALIEKMNMTDFAVVYGTTENSPATFTTEPIDTVERRVSTVGKVLDHAEAKIVDQENRIVKIGVAGELLIRGTCVMLGYWSDEEKTKEAIGKDRWYRTGDTAVMDEEGYVKIVGRIKDMICRGGENIYPTEVEKVLFTNPKVGDAHVIGVPDPRLGETLCAWIRLRHGETCSAEEIKEFCKGKMAHFKIPQYILFKQETDFPMTATGKIQKFKMRVISTEELNLGHVKPHFSQDTKAN